MLPLGRETDGAPLAAKQPCAELFLQLADALRYIGLNAIERGGGTADAALVDDGAEDLQGLEVDRSHIENDIAELFICASDAATPYSRHAFRPQHPGVPLVAVDRGGVRHRHDRASHGDGDRPVRFHAVAAADGARWRAGAER